jgi:DHA1 family tetracycline resistance protein-like MFS transporter
MAKRSIHNAQSESPILSPGTFSYTSRMDFDLFAIMIVNFSGSLGLSFVLPFLVLLVQQFGGTPLTFGIVGALYAVFQLIGAPLLGKWSDVYGRKPTLVLSQLGTVMGWLIFFAGLFLPIAPLFKILGFVVTLPLFVISLARSIDGITGGNVSIAQAYLSDISTDKNRSKNYGLLSVASNFGFIVGPALAGLLGSTALGAKLPVAAAIVISLVALLFIIFFLPESHKKQSTKKAQSAAQEKVSISVALKQKYIVYLLALYFFIYLGFSFFYTAFPEYSSIDLHWSSAQLGIFISVLSILMAIVQGPVLAFCSKRFNDSVLAIAGTFILGLNFVLLISHSTVVLYLAATFFALGNGLMWPSFLSIISKTAGNKYQGTIQGLSGSMGSLASISGLILGGVLYSAIGGYTFWVSAATIFAVFIVSFRLLNIAKEK